MIQNGRPRRSMSQKNHTVFPKSAKLVAAFGILVFTVFICSSAKTAKTAHDVGSTFGEGAYSVFAPVSGNQYPEDTFAEDKESIWMYLESVISRLIYGEK